MKINFQAKFLKGSVSTNNCEIFICNILPLPNMPGGLMYSYANIHGRHMKVRPIFLHQKFKRTNDPL